MAGKEEVGPRGFIIKVNSLSTECGSKRYIWPRSPPTQTLEQKVALTAKPSMLTARHMLVTPLSSAAAAEEEEESAAMMEEL